MEPSTSNACVLAWHWVHALQPELCDITGSKPVHKTCGRLVYQHVAGCQDPVKWGQGHHHGQQGCCLRVGVGQQLRPHLHALQPACKQNTSWPADGCSKCSQQPHHSPDPTPKQTVRQQTAYTQLHRLSKSTMCNACTQVMLSTQTATNCSTTANDKF